MSQAFSAVCGALLADRGTDAAAEFALDMLVPVFEAVPLESLVTIAEPKRELRALLRKEELPEPTYTILSETGRASHMPTFVVGVFSGDRQLAEAAGYSIKQGRTEAAKAALIAHYGSEIDGVLPTSWGAFAAADAEEWIRDNLSPPQVDPTDPE